MHLVALLRRPEDPAAAARVLIDASGMTPAEAKMRLAPEPPALLARLPEDSAQAVVDALRAAELSALALDEVVPRDPERTVARTLAFGPGALTVTPRAGPRVEIPWEDVTVILRAASAVRTTTDVTTTSTKFSPAMAIATGGLKMKSKVEETTRTTQSDAEQAIYVYGAGGVAAVLRERAMDFSCLGKDVQPVRLANLATIVRMLRERAKQAAYDERLVRLGTRALPFVLAGETRMATGSVSTARMNTAPGVDVLAEVLRQAFERGLLP